MILVLLKLPKLIRHQTGFCHVVKNGFILKLTAFKNLIMWAFPEGRVFRFNLFCGKKDHKKGFSLQPLTQNAVINSTKLQKPRHPFVNSSLYNCIAISASETAIPIY
jgi:hypothetical protein